LGHDQVKAKVDDKNYEKLLPNLKKEDVKLTHNRGHYLQDKKKLENQCPLK
jgi:hypothetical protein